MAATGGAAVATSMFGDALRQTSFGATTGGNVLVVISLRGGIDGLGMVVPHGDPGYYAGPPARSRCRRESLVAKDAMFGLHPAMAPLEWLWNGGELAAVHAVGMEVPEPLALPGDGGGRGRRPDLERPPRLGEPDGRPGRRTAARTRRCNLGDPITPTALVGASPVLGHRDLGQHLARRAPPGRTARGAGPSSQHRVGRRAGPARGRRPGPR